MAKPSFYITGLINSHKKHLKKLEHRIARDPRLTRKNNRFTMEADIYREMIVILERIRDDFIKKEKANHPGFKE